VSKASSVIPKSRSGSRSKSNSVSRSIRTFIGLGGGVKEAGVIKRKKDRDVSTSKTSKTG
jgi:hypothetical protein